MFAVVEEDQDVWFVEDSWRLTDDGGSNFKVWDPAGELPKTHLPFSIRIFMMSAKDPIPPRRWTIHLETRNARFGSS